MAAIDAIFDTASAVRSGRRAAEEVVGECLAAITAADSSLGAFLHVDADRALAQARKVDIVRRQGAILGPLAGVPLAVKDNMCTTFGATTCGSKILNAYHSPYNAHVVEALESAGAILVGKTNLDEFAMGSSTENSAFHTTRNPWDGARVAGGSSGGSAAAVASGMALGALGSDTGGSIRLPASFCGVVGLKPSYGRVSRYGLVAFGSSLDQIGPLTRNVRDAALLLSVISGHDERDSTCVPMPVPDYVAALDRPVQGLRIGISEEYFGEGLDDAVRSAVEGAIEVMCRQGAVPSRSTCHT